MNVTSKVVTMMALAILGASPVFADDTGVAAGSDSTAASVATGSTATIVAVGVGAAAIIGAVVAGSSGQGGTSPTSTTK